MPTDAPAHELELYREDDAFVVVADVSDYDPDGLTVRWQNGRLVVWADDADATDGRTRVLHRAVGLPRPVDVDGITASVSDGVLEVTLPTYEGDVPARDVPVESRDDPEV